MNTYFNVRSRVRHLFTGRYLQILGHFVPLAVLCNAANAQQCMKDATDGLAKSYFFASGDSFGQEYDRAFNNNNDAGNKWYRGGHNTTAAAPNWIGVNFGDQGAKALTGYLISTANDFPSRAPRDWTFQGSNDGTTWTDLDTRSGQSFAYTGQSRVFSFANTSAYMQYRLLITETSDPNESSIQIGELEFYEKVCLQGTVTNQGTPLSGVTVAILGETYSAGGGGGNVLFTALTDAAGQYTFSPAQIPDGQFSLIVQPPAGYQIASNTIPFFVDPAWTNSGQRFSTSQYYYSPTGAITFANHLQLAQSSGTTGSVYWDNQQSNTYVNRFRADTDKGNLNFTLKQAQVSQSCATLNGTPPFTNNLITLAENGTFGSFSTGTGAGSYLRVHPEQPGFSKDFSNTVLYGNAGLSNPTNTQYTYANKANEFSAITGWGAGVMIQESRFTVTSYIGTLGDLIDSNNDGNQTKSLINVYPTHWRKTYGTTTGDVYDKFLIINGAGNNLPFFNQPGLNLKGSLSYLFSFDGKNANATTQGINTTVSVPYRLLNSSGVAVASGTLDLPPASALSDDDASSPWQKVFVTLTPPSDGTYSLELRYPGGSAIGNDFYIDNISLRALTDYGDDPISYGEAVHGQPAQTISVSCDPLLYLGAKLDIENLYLASAIANADNLDNIDDEDGVTPATLHAGATSYSVAVSATNNTSTAATLYAWIDWDQSGTFESSERLSIPVPASSGTASYSLTWTGLNAPNKVYARFRLSSDPLAANPTGLASGGEVEDYMIEVPMPVTLASFDVTTETSTAILSWSTTSETNSDYFEIQRSNNARDWQAVGIQKSHGESSALIKYSFVDQTPSKGINYYRLKMVDFDGTFAFSRIRETSFQTLPGMVAFPNPASGVVFLKAADMTIRNYGLIDMNGRVILAGDYQPANGIDVSKLPVGTYLIRAVSQDNTALIQKIVVGK
ncbi:GEVED domain-containing protein [Dyadobacter sp. BHUBP1]|uniref:GEVED domain-containing protein n=1 Tax=Dyadobacter sp. BHUBP1 TaxID=3424178 RepID=UPI003D351939